MLKQLLSIALCFCLIGCERIALLKTPTKKPIISNNLLSKQAEKNFWNTLHQGNYDQINQAEVQLMQSYLENPNDPVIASHLGFLHIWKLTESPRIKSRSPQIVNEIILAKKYFADSKELNPNDARIAGFLGDSMLVEGKIFNNQRQMVRAYFQLKKAIRAWPEFNYFAAGFPMSVLNYQSKEFKEALEWQWKTLDLCAGQKINRLHPNFYPYLSLETQRGNRRACWNSWIAPHNFEGFFLNMGDMLVKQGNWQQGIAIYENAKLSKQYAFWPFKNLLESRILHAKENVNNFRQDLQIAEKSILFNSGYGCVVCHQSK